MFGKSQRRPEHGVAATLDDEVRGCLELRG
jgi:hypothetical protein